MIRNITLLIAISILIFGAITVQGKSSADVSLNEPAPFPENM